MGWKVSVPGLRTQERMPLPKEMEQKLATDKQDIMYSGLRLNAYLLKEGNESGLDELGL